jgi:transcription elongation factor Elf1
MAASRIKDCPPRPECPVCGMSMIIVKRDFVHEGMRCEYECLRCGHEESSQAA